jgi:hypothetical protein
VRSTERDDSDPTEHVRKKLVPQTTRPENTNGLARCLPRLTTGALDVHPSRATPTRSAHPPRVGRGCWTTPATRRRTRRPRCARTTARAQGVSREPATPSGPRPSTWRSPHRNPPAAASPRTARRRTLVLARDPRDQQATRGGKQKRSLTSRTLPSLGTNAIRGSGRRQSTASPHERQRLSTKRLPTRRSPASTQLAQILLISKRVWPRSRSPSGADPALGLERVRHSRPSEPPQAPRRCCSLRSSSNGDPCGRSCKACHCERLDGVDGLTAGFRSKRQREALRAGVICGPLQLRRWPS